MRYGIQGLAMWFLLLCAAVLCGAVREAWVATWLGEYRAHQVMTVVVCLVVFGLSAGFVYATQPGAGVAFATGSGWLVLCLVFEFGFFHFVMGTPWSVLLADYNVFRGRLLILLWLTTWLGPWIAVRLFHWARPE